MLNAGFALIQLGASPLFQRAARAASIKVDKHVWWSGVGTPQRAFPTNVKTPRPGLPLFEIKSADKSPHSKRIAAAKLGGLRRVDEEDSHGD
jgi:hypothetical protein